MSDEVRVSARADLRWRRTPVIAIGFTAATFLAGIGLAFSRPDVVAIGLPLALATAWMLLRRPHSGELELEVMAGEAGGRPEVRGAIDIGSDADWVQLAVDQGGRRTGSADVPPGTAVLTARSLLRHSGPFECLGVTARAVALDGAWVTDAAPRARLVWNAPPLTTRLGSLPAAPRLTGLHGAHEGSRPGHGGDFRDIHPFAPGDELRRVDWRATARAARQPGELLVRRNNALSDSSVVIAMDTAEDLGAVVASWGSDDPDRSGVTSLDLAREAALSIATVAIGTGDRVAYHALSLDGRSIPSGGGARHLARMRDVIAATGTGTEDSRYRRTPHIPGGSIVFVLSTYFDGAATDLATRWRAHGHAVVAVDVLPTADTTRLDREKLVAMRTLMAERSGIFDELRRAGVEVLSWSALDVNAEMRLAALRLQRGRGRGVRR